MSCYKIKFLKNKIYKLALAYLVVIAMPAHAGPNGKIGGNGGDQQNISCPQNLFAVGFKVKHDNQVIISIKLMCQGVNRNTGAPTGPIIATAGSRFIRPNVGLTEVTRRCSNGQFMKNSLTGFTGKVFSATVVSGLRFDCIRYSNINLNTGNSVRRQGQSRSIGPKLTGSARQAGFYDANLRDIGITRLAVRRGYALDSLMVYGAKMPWVIPAPRPSFIDGISIGGGSSSSQPQQDLYVELLSDLWRYSGSTTVNGVRYNAVPRSFCRTGMRSNGNAFLNTKRFILPPIKYSIVNAGGATNRNSIASEQFVRRGQNITVPRGFAANQRLNREISRGNIQRCVVQGSGLSCHECAGSTPYQDPTFLVRVDINGALVESNEHNNELRR